MSPVGTVTFSRVPRTAVVFDANYADMMIALGVKDRIRAMGWPKRFHERYVKTFYDQLPGVEVDTREIKSLGGRARASSKELLYALDPDVIHIDPLQIQSFSGWNDRDVEEIRNKVAPFFANRFSRRHNYEGSRPYKYYDVWELHARMAAVYKREDRARDLRAIGDALEKHIARNVPGSPLRALLVNYKNGTFLIRKDINGPGNQKQHLRKLNLIDALSAHRGDGRTFPGLKTDLEGILALEPDVLLEQWATGIDDQPVKAIRSLKNKPLGRKIPAIGNGRVYPGGTPLQGPIIYLFQLEMLAKMLYPDTFGPWRGHGNLPEDERLFDRRKVADIILREG